jgi:mono/diheme cytochrome c family protein
MRLSMPEIPDFASDKWQSSRTDAELANSILHGKGKFMLPMTDKLGSVDVKQMVALVRKFKGGKQIVPLQAPKAPGPPAPMVVTAPTSILPTPGGATALVEEPLVAPSGDLSARIRIGASIFQQFCIVCHGPDGTGAVMRARMPPIPDFTSPAFQDSHSDARLQISILDGKGSLMPANRGRVTEDEAADLKDFIRAFGPRRPAIATRAQPSDTQFDKEFRRLQEQWNALEKQLEKK